MGIRPVAVSLKFTITAGAANTSAIRCFAVANEDVVQFSTSSIIVGAGIVEKNGDAEVVCSWNQEHKMLQNQNCNLKAA